MNVAYLHIAAGRLTRFVAIAGQLGSEYWMPIVALAETAIERGRHDIARDVFAAADQPGQQRDYLHQRCIELTGAPPTPERHRLPSGDAGPRPPRNRTPGDCSLPRRVATAPFHTPHSSDSEPGAVAVHDDD